MSIYSNTQQKIAEKISSDRHVLASKWTDWHWQLKHSITQVETFEELLDIQLEPLERRKIELTLKKFPLSLTPYYLSLIDRNDFRNDPIFRQSFPDPQELIIERADMFDPLAEDRDSPAPGITHRYPDRVLFHVSNVCAMYCRHCTRKRKVGKPGMVIDDRTIAQRRADLLAAWLTTNAPSNFWTADDRSPSCILLIEIEYSEGRLL